jgi:hypothetical protein
MGGEDLKLPFGTSPVDLLWLRHAQPAGVEVHYALRTAINLDYGANLEPMVTDV